MHGPAKPWAARMVRAALALARRHSLNELLALSSRRFAPRRKPSEILALAHWLKLVHAEGLA